MAPIPVLVGRFFAVSLPVGSVLLSSKSMAESDSDEIASSELSIYDPKETTLKYQKRTKSTLETYISTARKSVCGITTQIIDATHGIRDSVINTKEKISSTTQHIINKEGLIPRMGLIGFAGLTGFIIAGRRKGILRRFFYPVGFLTVSSMLCYPVETVNISRSTWKHAKQWYSGNSTEEAQGGDGDTLISIANSIKATVSKGLNSISSFNTKDDKIPDNSDSHSSEDLVDSAPAVKDSSDNITYQTSDITEESDQNKDNLQHGHEQTNDNLQQDHEPAPQLSQKTVVSDEDVKREPESPVDKKETEKKLPVDYGQSSPEDADMYTTRK